MTKVIDIFAAIDEEHQSIPVFSSSVQGGFPSPAEDYIEKQLDLNELMIQHPAATFYVRVEGDSMQGAGIQSGDILVVDRALKAVSGKIVVAVINGEFTVKRLIIKNGVTYLQPENENYPTLKIEKESDFQVWGVVSYVVHRAL